MNEGHDISNGVGHTAAGIWPDEPQGKPATETNATADFVLSFTARDPKASDKIQVVLRLPENVQ